MKNLDELFPVTEYDAKHALTPGSYAIFDTADGPTVLKPGYEAVDDYDGYVNLHGVHGLDLLRNDEPFFMAYEDTGDLYNYLVAAGVILEDELAHKDPRRWLEAAYIHLIFRSKRAGVLFIERLNAFMHRKREKLLEFILYGSTLPCAVCGEKPSLQKSLACEDCVEGGEK